MTYTFTTIDALRAVQSKFPNKSTREILSLLKCTKRTYSCDDHDASQYLISNRDGWFLFSNGNVCPPRSLLV